MPRFAHWTPRYFADRLKLAIHEKAHPADPWLAQEAVSFLSTWMSSNDNGIEFGSGRSTLWLASRAKSVTSVEHDASWHSHVKGMLAAKGVSNAELLLIPKEPAFDEEDQGSAYSKAACSPEDGSLDFALVDGIYRSACALNLIPKMKSGGILIIDDSQRYLVYPTRSPYPVTEAALPPAWRRFALETKAWRRVHFVNGVSDTSILFKP